MNRLFATLIVFAMMLLAVALSFQQTLANAEQSSTGVLGLHLVAAFVLIGTANLVVWRHADAKEQLSRSRAELLQPLRRLLSAVWS